MGQISTDTARRIAQAWETAESLPEAMKMAGIATQDRRQLYRYRRQAEDMLGITLETKTHNHCTSNFPRTTRHVTYDHPYTVLIFSDAHFWPNSLSPAYWILLQAIEDLKPDIIVDNGDSLDGSSISRHPKSLWEDLPTLAEEIETCQENFSLIEDAAGDAELFRNIGNHDLRFEAKLAQDAPQYRGVQGTTVGELFPKWEHNISIVLNGHTVIKHRWHGGVHAAHNNVMKAGTSIVTGHTHRLKIQPYTDYTGLRYGIETGTIADFGDQFAYTEHTPLNWQQGFVVLTVDGKDLHPEICEVKGNTAFFRGKKYSG